MKLEKQQKQHLTPKPVQKLKYFHGIYIANSKPVCKLLYILFSSQKSFPVLPEKYNTPVAGKKKKRYYIKASQKKHLKQTWKSSVYLGPKRHLK